MADSIDRATCGVCGTSFGFRTPEPPATCWRTPCEARSGWTPGQWEGRARMAQARLAAGVPLDGLDYDALRRAERIEAKVAS